MNDFNFKTITAICATICFIFATMAACEVYKPKDDILLTCINSGWARDSDVCKKIAGAK